jgi:hypothetical protein
MADSGGKMSGLISEAKKTRAEREKGYREKALKMYPHVCARCGREHSGKRLSELTVHHKDHNHDNNPPDGSNWELLCIYCHDNEHQKMGLMDDYAEADKAKQKGDSLTSNPFAALGDLLKKEK